VSQLLGLGLALDRVHALPVPDRLGLGAFQRLAQRLLCIVRFGKAHNLAGPHLHRHVGSLAVLLRSQHNVRADHLGQYLRDAFDPLVAQFPQRRGDAQLPSRVLSLHGKLLSRGKCRSRP
jgi:hypothetical protein